MSNIIHNINYIWLSNKKVGGYTIDKIYSVLFVKYYPVGIIMILIVLVVILVSIRITSSKKRRLHNLNHNVEEISSKKNGRADIRTYDTKKNIKSEVETDTKQEVDFIDDKQLVAVITAAIMAYIGTDEATDEATDGLVIRSIRKVNRRKQTNDYSTY